MKSHHDIQKKTYSNLHKRQFNSKDKDNDIIFKQNSGILRRNPKRFLDVNDTDNENNNNNINFSVRNFNNKENNRINLMDKKEKEKKFEFTFNINNKETSQFFEDLNSKSNSISLNNLIIEQKPKTEKEEIISLINKEKINQILITEKLKELDKIIYSLNKSRTQTLKEKVEFEILNKKLNKTKNLNIPEKEKMLQISSENFNIFSTENEKIKNEKNAKLNFPSNFICSKKDKDEIELLNFKVNKLQEEIKKKEENNLLTIKNIKRKFNESEKRCEDLLLQIKELNNKNKALRSINEMSEKISSSIINSTRRSERKSIFDFNVINKVDKRESFMNNNLKNNTNNNNEFNSNNFKIDNFTENKILLPRSKSMSCDIQKIKSFPRSMSTANFAISRINNLNRDQLFKIYENSSKNNTDNYNYSSLKKYNSKDSKNLKSIDNKTNTSIDNSNINLNNCSLMQIIQSPENNNNNKEEEENPKAKFLTDDGIYEINFDQKYHKEKTSCQKILQTSNLPGGKLINFYENEKKEIIYPNGSHKEIYNDGYSIVYFKNKDIKQIYPNGKIVYFFSANEATKTFYLNNCEVLKFKNGQIEKTYADKTTKIFFPNGEQRILKDYEIETLLTN